MILELRRAKKSVNITGKKIKIKKIEVADTTTGAAKEGINPLFPFLNIEILRVGMVHDNSASRSLRHYLTSFRERHVVLLRT